MKPASNDRAVWLSGPAARCSVPPLTPNRAWRIVLLGAPGVGKGTQAQLLCQKLRACHLSTGDVFRAAKSSGGCGQSPAMLSAIEYMKRGELVPDEIVLDMLRERSACLRCCGGFLLDGFPRTVAQAEALQHLLDEERVALDAVLDFQLPLDEVVSRLSGRRTCAKCKAVFHVTMLPPKVANACDHCGGTLYCRDDDRPDAIRVRMEAYELQTAPLTAFYRRQGLLRTIPAGGTPDAIFDRALAALEARAA